MALGLLLVCFHFEKKLKKMFFHFDWEEVEIVEESNGAEGLTKDLKSLESTIGKLMGFPMIFLHEAVEIFSHKMM